MSRLLQTSGVFAAGLEENSLYPRDASASRSFTSSNKIAVTTSWFCVRHTITCTDTNAKITASSVQDINATAKPFLWSIERECPYNPKSIQISGGRVRSRIEGGVLEWFYRMQRCVHLGLLPSCASRCAPFLDIACVTQKKRR